MWLEVKKAFSHWVHTNGFSPVCERLCVFRLYELEKALPRFVLANPFSPVWKSVCVFKFPDWEKALLQWVHTNCLSPACNWLWALRALDVEKDFSHWVQKNSSVWEDLCVASWPAVVKALWHLEQKKLPFAVTVTELVCLQVTGHRERLVALGANKWFFPLCGWDYLPS